jgi:hypothetical protein
MYLSKLDLPHRSHPVSKLDLPHSSHAVKNPGLLSETLGARRAQSGFKGESCEYLLENLPAGTDHHRSMTAKWLHMKLGTWPLESNAAKRYSRPFLEIGKPCQKRPALSTSRSIESYRNPVQQRMSISPCVLFWARERGIFGQSSWQPRPPAVRADPRMGLAVMGPGWDEVPSVNLIGMGWGSPLFDPIWGKLGPLTVDALSWKLRRYGRTGGLKTQQEAWDTLAVAFFLMQKQAVAWLALCQPAVRFWHCSIL